MVSNSLSRVIWLNRVWAAFRAVARSRAASVIAAALPVPALTGSTSWGSCASGATYAG